MYIHVCIYTPSSRYALERYRPSPGVFNVWFADPQWSAGSFQVPRGPRATPEKLKTRRIITRAESVTENRNRYRDILKTETDTDVGIEKNEKNRSFSFFEN